MSLADILAKKKAALPTSSISSIEDSFVAALNDPLPEVVKTPKNTKSEVIVPPNIINSEVAATQVEKPMSFAERMLLKKQKQLSSTPAPVETVPTANTPVLGDTTIPVDQPVQLPSASEIKGTIEEALEDKEKNNSPETEQAYADISRRIEALAQLSDTPLENAMKELKVALLANPNAVSLMEDTDFGKMVIALRMLTKEAATEALKEKVSGKKSKSKISLDPDAVAAAFEEI